MARLQLGPSPAQLACQPKTECPPTWRPEARRTTSSKYGENVSLRKLSQLTPLKVRNGYLILITVRRRTGSKVWTDRGSAARRAGRASRCASGVFSAKRDTSRTTSHPRTAFVKCNSSSLCFNGAAQLSSSLLRRKEKPAGSPSLRVFLRLNACSSTLGAFNRTNAPFLQLVEQGILHDAGFFCCREFRQALLNPTSSKQHFSGALI